MANYPGVSKLAGSIFDYNYPMLCLFEFLCSNGPVTKETEPVQQCISINCAAPWTYIYDNNIIVEWVKLKGIATHGNHEKSLILSAFSDFHEISTLIITHHMVSHDEFLIPC